MVVSGTLGRTLAIFGGIGTLDRNPCHSRWYYAGKGEILVIGKGTYLDGQVAVFFSRHFA